MANTIRRYTVGENFALSGLVDALCAHYTALGYFASVRPLGNAVEVNIAKNKGGLYILTGLGEELTMTFSLEENELVVMYSNQYYTDKVVAFVVGWFCLTILWIPCAIGLCRQLRLPDYVDAEIYRYNISVK